MIDGAWPRFKSIRNAVNRSQIESELQSFSSKSALHIRNPRAAIQKRHQQQVTRPQLHGFITASHHSFPSQLTFINHALQTNIRNNHQPDSQPDSHRSTLIHQHRAKHSRQHAYLLHRSPIRDCLTNFVNCRRTQCQ